MMKSFTNYKHRSFSRISRTLLTAAALVAGLLTGSAPQAEAQVVYNEPFTVAGAYPQLILPRGWSQGKIVGASVYNQFEVVDATNATNPNPGAFPSLSTGLRFNSFLATAGDKSFIASKQFDMRLIPVAGTTFSFKMHRDDYAFYANTLDRIQVYLNDSAIANPSFGSMTLLAENVTTSTTIHRSTTQAPAVGAAGWYTYNYTIPQAGWATDKVYVIIVAHSEFGNNIFIDDFQITSYPQSQAFICSSALVVNQNVSTTAPGATDQQIIGIKFTMNGFGNGSGGTNGVNITDMYFNTNGSTNPVTDIVNAKLWTTGGSPLWSPANALLLATHTSPHFTNYGFFIPNVAVYYPVGQPTSYNTFEHGDNYLWITYNINGAATSGNFVDAEWVSIKSNGVNCGTLGLGTQVTTLPGSRKIDVVYCQPNYTVGTSWAGYFTNDYINGVELDGDITPGIQDGLSGSSAVNPRNRIFGPAGSRCTGATIAAPKLCAYQTHQPDYENFPESGYPATLSHAAVTQTTAKLTAWSGRISSGTNPMGYTIPGYGSNLSYAGYALGQFKLQVGDYGSGNAIAAWIDYNGDGVFNNYFDNIRKIATTTGGTILNIATAGGYTSPFTYTYGLNSGMRVYGPGVPAGTYIVSVNSTTQITVSATITAQTNEYYEFVNDGAAPGSPGNRGEKIAQSGPLPGWQTLNPQFKVPDWANNYSGKRRLRVREVWINYNINPCNTATYGEAEDYTVTISPECPVYIGPDGPYKTWLGFSSDWSDPANWCPEGAPIQGAPPGYITNLRFPGGPTGAVYPYTKAKIATGQQARAMKFRIETGDTVFIDAPQASDLIVTDSLIIQTPTSALLVKTSQGDTAQISNGVLQHNIITNPENVNMTPMRVSQKVRSQWVFQQEELYTQGLKYTPCGQVADVIDTIRIHMQRNSDGNIYKNFVIRYHYVVGNFQFQPNAWTEAGVNTSCASYPTAFKVVYTGDVDVSSIPLGGWGTIAIPLTNGGIEYFCDPSGSTYQRLLIDISYDQTGFPLTGARLNAPTQNEDIRNTQTGAANSFRTWSTNSDSLSGIPATDLPPNLHGTTAPTVPAASYVSTNIVCNPAIPIGSTVIPVSSVAGLKIGMTYPYGLLAGNVVTLRGNTIIAINAGALPYPTVTFLNPTTAVIGSGTCSLGSQKLYASHYQFRSLSNLRPNLTFSWKRVYRKYPIEVKGPTWTNHGNFVPAISRVTFSGSNTDIEGTVNTTFYDLDINNSVAVRLDAVDISVEDSLRLVGGRLKFNNQQLTLLRPEKWAMTWTNGRLQMDNDIIGNNVAPFSRLKWNMGTATDLRILPLVNVNNAYLPMSYKPATGTHNVTFTTYRTNPDNTNIPAPTVTNIFGWTGSGWGTTGNQLADRFYRIENLDATASVDFLNFSYQGTSTFPASERAGNNSSGATTMQAQRWLNDTTKWEQFPSFHPTQTYHLGALVDSVRVTSFTFGAPYGYWWVMTGTNTPLPVEMLEFTAIPYQDRVKLKWSTASEINSSHYVVERTIDNHDFSFIGQVQANGTTTAQSDYSLWDYKPVEGIQYYYLRQYDRDGQMKSYGPVSAKFSKEAFEIVTATIASSENGLQVVFSYDSEEPVNYRIIDMAGRIVASKDRNPATPGLNVIDIDVTLAKGAYQIILMNRDKQVTRKFFY